MVPLISIIVPVFNASQYLAHCLDSLSGQTFKDFEVILIDDGSTDDSGLICDRFCLKDQRFRVIHQANSGVTSARNKGLEGVRGEYVGFVDADDWVAEDYLFNLYETIKKNESDLVISAYYRYCSDSLVYITENKPSDLSLDVLIKEFISGQLCAAVWSQLYRASFLRDHAIGFPAYGFAEDSYFTISALMYAPKVAYCAHASYYYRKIPTSVTNDQDSEKRNYLFLAFKNNFVDLFNKFDLWDNRSFVEAFYYRMNIEKLCVLKGHPDHKSKELLSKSYPESYRYWVIDTAADLFYRSALKHGSAFPLKIQDKLLRVKYLAKKTLSLS